MQESIVNIIAEEREKYAMTQVELATHVGVTRQTIISIEKGNYVPSVLLALKLAKCFKQPVEGLFKIIKIK
jgi:putative transcriptional regulator